jgi:hypothetical protein
MRDAWGIRGDCVRQSADAAKPIDKPFDPETMLP